MKRLLATCLMLWVAALLGIAPAMADTQSDLNAFKDLQQSKWDAQKELQQNKWDSQKDLQQKDVDSLRQQIAAVDKRVDDQLAQVGQAVDRYGVAAAWIGIVVTVLLVLGGFLGYRNAKSEAKDAATESAIKQAEASAKSWLDAHAAALQERIATLEQKAVQVHGSMDTIHSDVQNHAANTKAEISDALIAVQGSVGKADEPPTPQQEKSQQILAVRAQELGKVESSYSFEDWDTRAHAAYRDGKFEDAAYFWRRAADVPNAGAAKVTLALVNRGVTQGQLNQCEAAITTCDEVVRRFGDATEPALREQVAKALVIVGNCQGQLNHSDSAIATYDEVVRRFGEDTEPALRELVAKALVNKGIGQGKLNQSEAVIATYDDVVRRFGDATEPALRKNVNSALNGSGFGRLLQAKRFGPQTPPGQDCLRTAMENLNDVIARSTQPNGVYLGNRAYVHYLSGRAMQADVDFSAALRAPDKGGIFIFEATLKDLDMHPIPEDQGMRELVERAWAAYQQEVGGGTSKDSSP